MFPDMQITPTQKWASANLLMEIDGILIRCAERATGRNTTLKTVDTILVPQTMRTELLEMLHHHPAHGHRGRISTYRILADHYFWIGMEKDIHQFIAECDTCQARRARRLDFAGPFGPSVKGNHYKYCLCIADQLSRFPILIPYKSTEAPVVIKALQERVYADFGMPEAIILDKAGSLKGDLMKAHAEENDIHLDLVSSGNHRANGLAERIVREFNDRMNLTCKEHWKTWHKSIKQTELSLRVTPSADTGTSPAQLLFGRQMRTTFHGINMLQYTGP